MKKTIKTFQDNAKEKAILIDIDLIKESILAHRGATGRWPMIKEGPVECGPYAGTETWQGLDGCLRRGTRGLPGNSSSAKVKKELGSSLKIDWIKECILAHKRVTGQWPTRNGGLIEHGPYAGRERWDRIDSALKGENRGIRGKFSLATVMESLGYQNPRHSEPLDIELIKESILAHKEATGRWPTQKSGSVEYGPYAGKEIWATIHSHLESGGRDLVGNSSLPAEKEKLGPVNPKNQEPLNVELIKESILTHKEATGRWPTQILGPIKYGPYAERGTWRGLNTALIKGFRGLPGGQTLVSIKEEAHYVFQVDATITRPRWSQSLWVSCFARKRRK